MVQVGDIVRLELHFYNDPHCYVPDLQGYSDLDYLHRKSHLDIDFSAWFKSLSLSVVRIDGEFVHAECEMLFRNRVFVFFADEVIVDKERSRNERQKRKNTRLEKAGQMRLF